MMNETRTVLAWCAGINFGILLIWSGGFVFAHDWLYRMHSRRFKLSVETFDAIHYGGLSLYKIGILLFNVVPLIALWLAR